MDDIDIMALASAAKRKGYSDPDRLIERLKTIIRRNEAYINRPYRQGRGYNEVVREDDEMLAYLIVLLEALKDEKL
jgi:hypothetical protein